MNADKTKAAGLGTEAAFNATYNSNSSDRNIFAQCMMESAALCFQSASEDFDLIGTLDPIKKRRSGSQILRALRGVTVHSTLAQEPPWPLGV